MKRCWQTADPMLLNYHDTEWGVPVHDERLHFEFLTLEAFQAGLSWTTMLKKRENFRRAFNNFDPEHIARYDEQKILTLLDDAGIIRNRRKIQATINNARCFLRIQAERGSFDNYIWSFVDGKPLQNQCKNWSDVPAQTELSATISSDLRKRGFQYLGAITVYAHMQSIGLVNDHLEYCFRYKDLS
ncbi:MAG: DNA-3-methyladenine glycosylase I [Spirochaetales bacterium]|nr:DNA-3-methyladenine glycosylase I [Spirochaetales bacterium]